MLVPRPAGVSFVAPAVMFREALVLVTFLTAIKLLDSCRESEPEVSARIPQLADLGSSFARGERVVTDTLLPVILGLCLASSIPLDSWDGGKLSSTALRPGTVCSSNDSCSRALAAI